jgi:tetratricopeptide (TPR) repeat protein
MDQHDCSAARDDAEEVLKANPEDVRTARIIAAAYAVQNEQRKAGDRLAEIVAYRPKSAPLQSLLGDWYMSTGRLEDARKAFEAAKTANPRFRQADLAWPTEGSTTAMQPARPVGYNRSRSQGSSGVIATSGRGGCCRQPCCSDCAVPFRSRCGQFQSARAK